MSEPEPALDYILARYDKVQDLGSIEICFGKYSGKSLFQVPIKYLDITVSLMPQTWFVRRVIEFVDLMMPAAEHFDMLGWKSTFYDVDKALVEYALAKPDEKL